MPNSDEFESLLILVDDALGVKTGVEFNYDPIFNF